MESQEVRLRLSEEQVQTAADLLELDKEGTPVCTALLQHVAISVQVSVHSLLEVVSGSWSTSFSLQGCCLDRKI